MIKSAQEIAVVYGLVMWAVFACVSGAVAQDWTQWRGPNRDGVVASSHTSASWANGLTEQWTVQVGSGYATPLLVGERLYMYTRQGNNEVMMALDADSGMEIWRTSYAAPFDMHPGTVPHGPGPKSTPAYAAGRLFTLGMTGIVTALDAETGDQLWQTPASTTDPPQLFHTAMSPVVDGDSVIFHVGGHDNGELTAFDVSTGDIRWSWSGYGPAYGSPLVVELEGVRQVVTFTREHLIGVSVDAGALLWQRPFPVNYDTSSQTPILFKDMLIQAGRDNGITAFRVIREGDAWTTDDVWQTTEVSLHMTNGVVADGVLLGLSHLNSGQYFGLDLETGEVLWKGAPRQAENAAMILAGDTVISLEDDAELLVVRPNRLSFDVVERYEVASSSTWTQPTLSGDRLYVKDLTSLTLWTLE